MKDREDLVVSLVSRDRPELGVTQGLVVTLDLLVILGLLVELELKDHKVSDSHS